MIIKGFSRLQKYYKWITGLHCHGFEQLLRIRIEHHIIPFYGILVSPNEVTPDEANCLFPDFYIQLLTTLKIQEALKVFIDKKKKYFDNDVGWGMFIADDFFMHISKIDYENRKNPYKLRRQAEKTIKEEFGIKKIILQKKQIISFVRASHKWSFEIHKEERDKLFMLDKFPEDRKRYDFPETVEEMNEYHSIYETLGKKKCSKRKKRK